MCVRSSYFPGYDLLKYFSFRLHFSSSRGGYMRFLASENVLEPLMEDIHDIPEYFPPNFNCFAMKVEPLMWFISILVSDSVSSWSISILARGASRRAIEWSRLLELGQGPKSTGEWSRGHEILISLISWGLEKSFFSAHFFLTRKKFQLYEFPPEWKTNSTS